MPEVPDWVCGYVNGVISSAFFGNQDRERESGLPVKFDDFTADPPHLLHMTAHHPDGTTYPLTLRIEARETPEEVRAKIDRFNAEMRAAMRRPQEHGGYCHVCFADFEGGRCPNGHEQPAEESNATLTDAG